MDPFRDELTSAHAKISALEAEMHELRTVVAPYIRHSFGRREIMLVVAIGIACLALGFIAGESSQQSAERTRMSESQPGVAIAPTARSTMPLAAASFGPAPPAVDKQDPHAGEKKPCNCTPGDPLCTCL